MWKYRTLSVVQQADRIKSLITHIQTHTDTPRHTQTHTHTHTPTHTHTHPHSCESVSYLFVISLACWLHICTLIVRGGPATGIHLSVIQFILLIGPWPRRAQGAGLRLLNATLDLHLPLQCLEEVEWERWIIMQGEKNLIKTGGQHTMVPRFDSKYTQICMNSRHCWFLKFQFMI